MVVSFPHTTRQPQHPTHPFVFHSLSSLCMARARIFKLLRGPGIDSKESIPPAYIAWRAGTTTLFLYLVPSPLRLFKNSNTVLAGRAWCVEPIPTTAKNCQNYGLRESIPPELWTRWIPTSNPYLFCTGSSIVHLYKLYISGMIERYTLCQIIVISMLLHLFICSTSVHLYSCRRSL